MATLDPDALKQFQFLVFTKLEGAVTAGMIHLGDQLGLYRALADADDAADLRRAGGAHRARRAVGAGVGLQPGGGPDPRRRPANRSASRWRRKAVAVLASPEHEAFGIGMFHDLPQMLASLERLPESFRNGLGFDYDSHGPESAIGMERSFEPWNRVHLLPTVLPTLDGLVAKLAAGARAADIGCGAGGAVLLLAEAFPTSRFAGYDISRFALDRAATRLAEAGLDNASFHDAREHPLPTDHSVDFVTTFDCIHDMTDPQGMMAAIRTALADDGTWLLVDIKARDTFAENAEKNPMASLMYGISVLSCMSSALSEPGGAGLGTLGLPASRAEAMAREAGFTRFRRLPVEHAINAFYEVRP